MIIEIELIRIALLITLWIMFIWLFIELKQSGERERILEELLILERRKREYIERGKSLLILLQKPYRTHSIYWDGKL